MAAENKPKILALKDADGNNAYAMSHTDGIKMRDGNKTLTEEMTIGKELLVDKLSNYPTTNNKGYIGTSGAVVSTGTVGWKYTDYIKVSEGNTITYSSFYTHASVLNLAFYDANKAYISGSGIQQASGTATMPNDAVYVRFCTGSYADNKSEATWNYERNVYLKERIAALVSEVNSLETDKADSFIMIEPRTLGDASPSFTHQYNGYGSMYKTTFAEGLYVTRIKTHNTYTGEGYIVVGTPDNVSSPTSCTITEVHKVSMSGFETDLTPYNIFIPAGSCVGIAGISVTGLAFGSGKRTPTWYIARVPSVGSTLSSGLNYAYSCDAEIELSVKAFLTDFIKELGITTEDIDKDIDIVSIDNAECIICEGSSYTEGVCQPIGFSWTEKLNSVIDIPVINDGVSGSRRTRSLTNIKDGSTLVNTPSVNNLQLPLRWAFFGNTANHSSLGLDGYNQLKECKYYAERRGIEMLVGEEERGQTGDYDPLSVSFASQEKVKLCDNLNRVGRKLYSSANYAGLSYQWHNGWREVSVYSLHYDFFKSIPIKHTLKLYRPRPMLSVNAVNDLFYSDPQAREKKWYAIGSGQNGSSSSPKISMETADNLDDITYSNPSSSYDVSEYSYSGTRESEIALLLSGSAISFTGYALIEFILNLRKIDSASVAFKCSVEPSSIYISGETGWDALAFTYDSGNNMVTASTNSDFYLKNDKISILVVYSGDFTIATPSCRATGSNKVMKDWSFERRKYGNELLSQTDILDWTGGTQITLPAGLFLYSSYNNIAKILSLSDNTTTATKSFVTTSDVKDVAIRIVAQNFFKIMTKRFDIGGELPEEFSDYVNNENVSLVNWQYDKGQMVLLVDDAYVFVFDVESGWCESYCEIHGLKAGNHTLAIKRANDINTSTPIWVHDVSVQAIK